MVDHLHHVGGAVGGHVVVVRLVDGVSLLLHHRGAAADTAAPGDGLKLLFSIQGFRTSPAGAVAPLAGLAEEDAAAAAATVHKGTQGDF